MQNCPLKVYLSTFITDGNMVNPVPPGLILAMHMESYFI